MDREAVVAPLPHPEVPHNEKMVSQKADGDPATSVRPSAQRACVEKMKKLDVKGFYGQNSMREGRAEPDA